MEKQRASCKLLFAIMNSVVGQYQHSNENSSFSVTAVYSLKRMYKSCTLLDHKNIACRMLYNLMSNKEKLGSW